MKRFNKFIGWLFFFAIQAAYNTFLIWGLVKWNVSGALVSNQTTVILAVIPTLLVFNIIIGIPVAIFFNGIFKKEKKPKFKVQDKVSGWFKRDMKEEDIENWFKKNVTEEKIASWIKEKTGESVED